jgi:hypothetical protein
MAGGPGLCMACCGPLSMPSSGGTCSACCRSAAGWLPTGLIIAFISQRTKNNWPALIAHLLFNGLALYLVVTAVIGT